MQHETVNTVSFYVLYFLLVYNLHVEFFHWFSPGNTTGLSRLYCISQCFRVSFSSHCIRSDFFISEFLVLQFCPLLFREVLIGNLSPCSLPFGARNWGSHVGGMHVQTWSETVCEVLHVFLP